MIDVVIVVQAIVVLFLLLSHWDQHSRLEELEEHAEDQGRALLEAGDRIEDLLARSAKMLERVDDLDDDLSDVEVKLEAFGEKDLELLEKMLERRKEDEELKEFLTRWRDEARTNVQTMRELVDIAEALATVNQESPDGSRPN